MAGGSEPPFASVGKNARGIESPTRVLDQGELLITTHRPQPSNKENVMYDPIEEATFAALARHLDIDPQAIGPSDHLEEKWGVDAFDLVFLAIDLEDTLDVRLPLAALVDVTKVSELVAAVRTSSSTVRVAELPTTEAEPESLTSAALQSPALKKLRERMRRRDRRGVRMGSERTERTERTERRGVRVMHS